MGRPPTVSIVIPTFNRAGLIGETLQSVLSQTLQDIEVIVVDDGSTDDTSEVLARYNGRIRVLRQQNRGPSAAKNLGMAQASGTYIALQDSDDLWVPDKLEEQVSFLDTCARVDLVFGDLRRFGSKGTVYESLFGRLPRFKRLARTCVGPGLLVLDGDVYGYLLEETPIFGQTVVFRRSLLDRAGWFDESICLSEDWDLWLRMARVARLGYVDRVVTLLRQHGGNLSGRLAERILGEIRVLEMVEQRDTLLTDLHRQTIRRAKAQKHFDVGYERFCQNRFADAREQFGRCLDLDPRHEKARTYRRLCRWPHWVLRSMRAVKQLTTSIRWGDPAWNR